MERMEQEGIVGQPNHAGKREILVEGPEEIPSEARKSPPDKVY